MSTESGTDRRGPAPDEVGRGAVSRRGAVYGLGASLGSLAFTSLLAAEQERARPL
ncbi:MAG: hypothetical protein ACKOES_09045 [Planctomycetaceae bacterium]